MREWLAIFFTVLGAICPAALAASHLARMSPGRAAALAVALSAVPAYLAAAYILTRDARAALALAALVPVLMTCESLARRRARLHLKGRS